MARRLLHFCGYVAACRCNKKWLGFAIRAPEIETAEIDNGGADNLLAQVQPFSEARDDFTYDWRYAEFEMVICRG